MASFNQDSFIELDRVFVRQEESADAEGQADQSYLSESFQWSRGAAPKWPTLLLRPRVVILGEAGSGKTWEMREQVAKLSADGHNAYFIRLDELAVANCRSVLTGEVYDRLQSQLASGASVSIFLDSVDEAKLVSPVAFRAALKNLREVLPTTVLPALKLYLSTRISAWNGDADLPWLRDLFGRGQSLTQAPLDDEGENGVAERQAVEDDWVVFKISPLNRDQVAKLATASGVPSASEFLTSIDAAHAWEFARRPSDVKPLAQYWLKHRRLGTLTELIEFDVTQKLRESRVEADDAITDDEARIGAETLAAGSVLCQFPVIRLPTAENPEALDGRACLPAEHWVGSKYAALLDRPIFDEANLGKVRFHHRRVREYLAARWIERQMHAGCPLDELENIFFDRVGGVRVMRGSLSPVAAWLCSGNNSWNGFMRQWVRETRPEIVLRYGDPHALTPKFRRELLHDLVARAKSAQHLWLSTDDAALSRFGHVEIASDLAQVAADSSLASDLRIAALEIIKLCELKTCCPQVLAVFIDPDEEDRIRQDAGLTIVAIGDDAARATITSYLLQRQKLTMALAGIATGHLWPNFLTHAQLVELLSRVQLEDDTVSGIEWQVADPLTKKASVTDACELARLVLALTSQAPCYPADHDTPPISQRYGWLRPLLRVFATKILQSAELSKSDAELAAECVATFAPNQSGEQSPDPISEATKNHPLVRRAYLWRRVALARVNQKRQIEGWWDLSFAGNYRISPIVEDVFWLADDIKEQSTAEDKLVALRLAWGIAAGAGVPRRFRSPIRTAARHDEALRREYVRLTRAERLRPLNRLRFRTRDSVLSRYWWQRQTDRVQKSLYALRDRWFFIRNRRRLRKGELIHVLSALTREADRKDRGSWAPSSWIGVEKKWGAQTSHAARTGCKRVWRRYTPRLPHEKNPRNQTPHEVIVGLAGIKAEWLDRELNFSRLTDSEVQQLARYAAEELNGFPEWLQPLIDARPGPVGAVLAEAIRGEWNDPSTNHGEPDVLRKMTRLACERLDAVKDTLAACLAAGDPANLGTLAPALSVMLNCGPDARGIVANEALKRSVNPASAVATRARWLTTLLMLRGQGARPQFEKVSAEHTDADAVITAVCAYLSGRLEERTRRKPEAFMTAAVLEWFIPIVYRHVRPNEDIHHSGAYSPNARDEAQRMREGLIETLAQQGDSDVPRILSEFGARPEFATHVDWLRHSRIETLQRMADQNPWQPSQLRQFQEEHARSPATAADLFRITLNRLKDIKKEVEQSDSHLKNSIARDVNEAELRRWLADRLDERARSQFTSPQESVIIDEQRPDIRVQHPAAGSVSIEIKWATDWSFNDLKKALEDQLVTRYLRAHNSNHGILVLGRHALRQDADKMWMAPAGPVDLAGLIDWLTRRAQELEAENMNVKRIEVICINFVPS